MCSDSLAPTTHPTRRSSRCRVAREGEPTQGKTAFRGRTEDSRFDTLNAVSSRVATPTARSQTLLSMSDQAPTDDTLTRAVFGACSRRSKPAFHTSANRSAGRAQARALKIAFIEVHPDPMEVLN